MKSDEFERECSAHQQDYSEESFWEKVKQYAKKVGLEGMRNALRLYYALDNPDMPPKIKAIIYGALGYFISPLDILPDVLPVVGFTDDIAVLAAAVVAAASYINEDVKARADKKLIDWFGTAQA